MVRRQKGLEASNAATDIQHSRIGPQQSPFGQAGYDLGRGTVQNIGGAERIERNRGFRRDSHCPVELLTDRSNGIAIIGRDAHQPLFSQADYLGEMIHVRFGQSEKIGQLFPLRCRAGEGRQ